MSIWVEVLTYVIAVFAGIIIGLLMGMKMYKPKNVLKDAAPAANEDDNDTEV